MKEAVKRKKCLYRKALNDKTDQAWELYREAKSLQSRWCGRQRRKIWLERGSYCKGTILASGGGFGRK